MPRRSLTTRAFLASLILHVLLGLLTWNHDFLRVPEAAAVEDADAVTLLLEPAAGEDDVLAQDDLPRTYTSVPERQEAETPPAIPDFLSVRDSRAADLVPGGEALSPPRSSEEGEFSQVAIAEDVPGAVEGIQVLEVPEAAESVPGGPAGVGEQSGGPRAGRETDSADGAAQTLGDPDAKGSSPTEDEADGGFSRPDLSSLLASASPSILSSGEQGRRGDPGFDYDQTAMSATSGNTFQFGEFALNTLEWDFAPWLERFKQDFRPNWIPPYAYFIGVIEGRTLVKVVIDPDGTLVSAEVIEQEGHEALHKASVAALRATAPFAPLPADFPEPNLVLIMALHYSGRSESPDRVAPPRSARNPGGR